MFSSVCLQSGTFNSGSMYYGVNALILSLRRKCCMFQGSMKDIEGLSRHRKCCMYQRRMKEMEGGRLYAFLSIPAAIAVPKGNITNSRLPGSKIPSLLVLPHVAHYEPHDWALCCSFLQSARNWLADCGSIIRPAQPITTSFFGRLMNRKGMKEIKS